MDGTRVFPDDVLLEGNAFYNDTPRPTKGSVTLLDIVGGKRWIVRDNLIADFAKNGGDFVSYAAFFKGNSRDGLFEGNLVICELRHHGGVRVGLSLGGGGTGKKFCENQDCRFEHTSGTIQNNIIMHCPQDVGIYLNKARDTHVYHNTLYNTHGVDVRFNETNADIRNNVISGRIKARDGGAYASSHNFIGTDSDIERLYENPRGVEYDLQAGTAIVDSGFPVPTVRRDYCGVIRDQSAPDLGAIENAERVFCAKFRDMVP
jgi:hypothetical protein